MTIEPSVQAPVCPRIGSRLMKWVLFTIVVTQLAIVMGCAKGQEGQSPAVADSSGTAVATPPATPASPAKPVMKPGDPALTLALVTESIPKFKGKRVRWFGKMMTGESKEKDGKQVINAIYVNNSADAEAKDFLYFAVEYESKGDDFFSSMPPSVAWVNGTVMGQKSVSAAVTSADGTARNVERIAPLLADPEFEPVEEKP